jgi:hypothetical protein
VVEDVFGKARVRRVAADQDVVGRGGLANSTDASNKKSCCIFRIPLAGRVPTRMEKTTQHTLSELIENGEACFLKAKQVSMLLNCSLARVYKLVNDNAFLTCTSMECCASTACDWGAGSGAVSGRMYRYKK